MAALVAAEALVDLGNRVKVAGNCLREQDPVQALPAGHFLYQTQLPPHIKAAALVLPMMRLCMAAVAGIVLALPAAQTNLFGAAAVAVLLPQILLLALRYLVEMVVRAGQPGLPEHSPAAAAAVPHQEILALAALAKSLSLSSRRKERSCQLMLSSSLPLTSVTTR